MQTVIPEDYKSNYLRILMERFDRCSVPELLIIGVAAIDDLLIQILKKRLVETKWCASNNFGVFNRLNLALSTQSISKELYKGLTDLIEIRNKFAHNFIIESLSHEKVSDPVTRLIKSNHFLFEHIADDVYAELSRTDSTAPTQEEIVNRIPISQKIEIILTAFTRFLLLTIDATTPVDQVILSDGGA